MNDTAAEQSDFGKRLSDAREAAGLTQSGVAAWLTERGINCIKQTVSAWEGGRNMPNPLVRRRLCHLYECSADSLLWGHDKDAPGAALPAALARRLSALGPEARQLVLVTLETTLNLAEALPSAAAVAPAAASAASSTKSRKVPRAA